MNLQCTSAQRLWLPLRRNHGVQRSCSRSLTVQVVHAAAKVSPGAGEGSPDLPVAPLWKRGILRAVQIVAGAVIIATASDVLRFLGSKPPWNAEEWRSLTVNLDPDLTLPAPKRINPTIIYDKNKVEIARFASNAIPLNQVRNRCHSVTASAAWNIRGAQFSRGCQCLNTMQMPGYVWQALVSAEDRSFFHHPGIDFKGLARAVLFFGGRGGGSTLTQQLIKNLFLSDSKTISRCDSVICGGLEMYRSRVGLHSTPMPCKMIRRTAIPSPQANSA